MPQLKHKIQVTETKIIPTNTLGFLLQLSTKLQYLTFKQLKDAANDYNEKSMFNQSTQNYLKDPKILKPFSTIHNQKLTFIKQMQKLKNCLHILLDLELKQKQLSGGTEAYYSHGYEIILLHNKIMIKMM